MLHTQINTDIYNTEFVVFSRICFLFFFFNELSMVKTVFWLFEAKKRYFVWNFFFSQIESCVLSGWSIVRVLFLFWVTNKFCWHSKTWYIDLKQRVSPFYNFYYHKNKEKVKKKETKTKSIKPVENRWLTLWEFTWDFIKNLEHLNHKRKSRSHLPKNSCFIYSQLNCCMFGLIELTTFLQP